MINFKVLFFILLSTSLYAQFISVKTIPVASGDQFLLYPSQNLSMGGANIALEDKWLNPIKNPANVLSIISNNFFIQPTFYNISGNLGGAMSLPFTAFITKNNWSSVISFAYQRLEGAGINRNQFGVMPLSISNTNSPFDRYSKNLYLLASLARKLNNSNWSLGASFFYSYLQAIGGVDLLYGSSSNVEQDGSIHEIKFGTVYNDNTSKFEALLLFNNFDMMHKVIYTDIIWDNEYSNPTFKERLVNNLDNTDTWGTHVLYKEKINDNGLELGIISTFNWKRHPKIPNYDLMNIPRDPGNTYAFNFGVGIGKDLNETRIGFDFIYEPIWSNTWANADQMIELTDGRKIYPGDKTIENDFKFNNWIGRLGVMKIFGTYNLSTGIEVYSRNYSLNQYDYLNRSNRIQEESWLNFTWSWGIGFEFKYFNLKYNGHLILGSGIPGISSFRLFESSLDFAESADIIAAPSGQLNLQEETISTHQFIIQVPFGKF